ncbi:MULTISPECIES: hypothetical protein [unclassified Brucella]|uniref:hypothetical protein n=1 Tax=Brucella amazoniensis TaxID=2837955 RepID=UPI0038508740
MAVSAVINNIPNIMVSNISSPAGSQVITATLTYDGNGNDAPKPGTDRFTFIFASNPNGNVKVASGSSLDAAITQDSANPNVYTASITVIAAAYGVCSASGNKTGDSTQWLASATSFSILPSVSFPVITRNPSPALQVSPVPGTPDSDATLVTQMDVTVTDEGGNPIPDSSVTFTVKDVRTTSATQTGVFYSASKTPISLAPLTPQDPRSDSRFAQATNKLGVATIFIATNQNPGYLRIFCETNTIRGASAFVYIFDTAFGTELEAPDTDIGPDLSNYTDTTFPVTINNKNTSPNEFIALFLNNKFQNQIAGTNLNENGSALTVANAADLNVGSSSAKPQNNFLYTIRTSNGDLINSKTTLLQLFGPLPTPNPKNQILGPLVDPNGGVINLGSIFIQGNPTDYTTTIDLSKDKTTLADKMSYTLKQNDIVTLHATFQGDFQSDDNFQVNPFTYTKTITDPTDSAFNIIIPFDDISGYGTPKDPKRSNLYKMYYEITPASATIPIAASSLTQGVLSTRVI